MKKINVSNEVAINAELDRVQKRTSAREMKYFRIGYEIERIEDKLFRLLPKKSWKGVQVNVDTHAQTFAGAYSRNGGIPMSTQYTLERGSKTWFVTNITRGVCKSPTNYHIVTFTDEQKEKMVEYITRNF